jgi:Tfp pilus assembly protein PilO
MINNRIWYAGTALVSVAVLVLGWFIGVAPQLAAAAAAQDEVAIVQAQNAIKETELARLRVQFENVSDTKDELAAVRESLPRDAAMTDFLAELERLQAESSVTLTGISVNDAQPYAPVVTEGMIAEAPAEAEAEAEGEAAVETAPAGTAGAAAGTPTATAGTVLTDPRVTAENFVLIPIDIEIAGSAENTAAFIGALQGTKRLFLVSDVTMEAVDEATSPLGGQTVALSGFLYVLLDSFGAAEPAVVDAPPVAGEAAGTINE